MAGMIAQLARRTVSRMEAGRTDIVVAGMQRRFSFWVYLLFAGCFRQLPVPQSDVERVKEYARQGTIVYVMYCRSVLDYLYCNLLFLKAGLPLSEFANGMDLAGFLPLHRLIANLWRRLLFRLEHLTIPDPLTGERVARLIHEKRPAMFFLTRSRSLFSSKFGFEMDPVPALIQLQRESESPIFIIPQTIVWEKRPETLKERTIVEIVFGDPDSPGVVRKLVHFLRTYRSAQLKIGEAVDLKQFLKDQVPGVKVERLARRVRWVLRHYLYRERKGSTGPLERSRGRTMVRIARHKDVEEAVQNWCKRTGKPIQEGKMLARKYIEEIIPDRRWGVIMFLDHLIRAILKVFYDGIDVDKEQLERIKQVIKDSPVVFVSSHKSHMDYLIAGWVFFRHEVTLPYVCAGINLNFWPMGRFFRASGAYFIRRAYPEPDLYPVVLERYIRDLLTTGQSQLFFIEGGRSRTGKLLRPKLGILSKVVDGYRANVCKNVVLVPVSIGYDRILEEKSYSDEAHGQEKPKEDVGTLLRFLQRMFGARYGKIYMNFDEPIGLGEYLEKNDGPEMLEKLAGRICFGMNRVSVVFPAALVALVLLSHRKRGLSRLEISQNAKPFVRYLDHRQVRFSDAFANREYAYDSALKALVGSKMVRVSKQDGVEYYTVDESKRLLLNYYKNNILHFLVSLSFVAIGILALARKKGESVWIPFLEIEGQYEFLQSLFSREFYFRPKEATSEYLHELLEFLVREGDLERSGEEVRMTAAGRQTLEQYREVAFNFLESYALVLSVAWRFRRRTLDEKDLLREIRGQGKRYYMQGKIERFESLSHFTLQNALNALSHKDILTKGERRGSWKMAGEDDVFERWRKPLAELMGREMA